MQLFSRIVFVLLASYASTCLAEDYDIVLLNGRVMDPETRLDAKRNVGIKDGVIVAITKDKITGRQTVDVGGHVVAPGAIRRQPNSGTTGAIDFGSKQAAADPLQNESLHSLFCTLHPNSTLKVSSLTEDQQ